MIPLLPGQDTLRHLTRLRLRWRGNSAAPTIGSRRARRPGSSREFLGLRPYEIGDDVRDLDWAATLRFDRPYLRVYEQGVESSLLLLVDASASMAHGDPPKLEYAQGLAGALGYIALAHADRVGALAFTDSVVASLPATRRAGQWRALREVVGGVTAGGSAKFSEVSQWLRRVGGTHGLIMILSDFFPPEAFADGLRRLGRSSLCAVAVQLISPHDLDPALEGDVELVDAETGEERAGWIGSAERAAYDSALASLAAQVSAICRDAGIRYVRVSTAMSIVRCLQETMVQEGVLCRERS